MNSVYSAVGAGNAGDAGDVVAPPSILFWANLYKNLVNLGKIKIFGSLW